MSYTFRSCFANKLQDFLQMKRVLDFKYGVGQQSMLKQIDVSALKLGINSEGVTRELAEEISKVRPNESARTRYARVSMLIDFSSYLVDLEIPSFIPHKPRYPSNTEFTPHMYSDEQLLSIVKASDNLRVSELNRDRSPIFYIPVLMRLLIGTGLRIGEALKLKVKDVVLEKNILIVRAPKNGKDREVPFSASLKTILQKYLEYRLLFCATNKKSEFLFINGFGSPTRQNLINTYWQKILKASEIPFRGRSKSPRVHDLRHTFITTANEKLIQQGFDPDAALAIIAAYVGHQSVVATQKDYLHSLESRAASLMKDVEIFTTKLYPRAKK